MLFRAAASYGSSVHKHMHAHRALNARQAKDAHQSFLDSVYRFLFGTNCTVQHDNLFGARDRLPEILPFAWSCASCHPFRLSHGYRCRRGRAFSPPVQQVCRASALRCGTCMLSPQQSEVSHQNAPQATIAYR